MMRGMPSEGLDAEPRLLLVDTCGREASVAVSVGAVVVAERRFAGRGAAETLVGEVRAALAEAACGLRDLAAISVVRGPGSFTGGAGGARDGEGAGGGGSAGADCGVAGWRCWRVRSGRGKGSR